MITVKGKLRSLGPSRQTKRFVCISWHASSFFYCLDGDVDGSGTLIQDVTFVTLLPAK